MSLGRDPAESLAKIVDTATIAAYDGDSSCTHSITPPSFDRNKRKSCEIAIIPISPAYFDKTLEAYTSPKRIRRCSCLMNTELDKNTECIENEELPSDNRLENCSTILEDTSLEDERPDLIQRKEEVQRYDQCDEIIAIAENSIGDSELGEEQPLSEDDIPLILRAFANNHSSGLERRVMTQEARFRVISRMKKEDLEILHPELAKVWEGLDTKPSISWNPIKQPSDLKLALLPFQKEGVAWMIEQEHTEFHGGILADEMGMGKTIQMISLLLSKPRRIPNLVVTPTVALMQWHAELTTHTDALSVLVFHGSGRTGNGKELKKHDVVLTTYSIIESAFRKQEVGFKQKGKLIKAKSPLHEVSWHRIILDEAHSIKDRSSNTSHSVFALNSKCKWSLSGTPLQNRVSELYSLLRFLQADPYSYYYCQKCPCKSLIWQFGDKRHCDDCGHAPVSHVCWWNQEILKPIQNFGTVGLGKLALQKLGKILDRVMLRRTKLERADDLGLPPRNITIRYDHFSEEEKDIYESLYTDSIRKFDNYVQQGTVLSNYANIFDLLMKMRQVINHPDLVLSKNENKSCSLVCGLCSREPDDPIVAKCKHLFCREEVEQYLQSSLEEVPLCPICFARLTVNLTQPTYGVGLTELTQPISHSRNCFFRSSIVNRIDMKSWRSSTKIEALLEELVALRKKDSTIKSIVFSQFVNFLDLIQWRLNRAGFSCCRLDGRMRPLQREAVINAFTTIPELTVFLISLKAGGVALNLTEASQIFIMDPWWNPAVENQAMDRIHRLGQNRPVQITRLIVEDSIESRILQLQEKKKALFDSTIGKDIVALSQLSEEDLRFLFVL